MSIYLRSWIYFHRDKNFNLIPIKMFTTNALLALCAVASTAVAENNLNFVYSTNSYDDIQNSGSGYSAGFTLKDTSGNTLYSNSDPYGYSPCMDDSEKIQITSDCWTGTYTFGCESSYGNPSKCTAYDPAGATYSGTADSNYDFIGISAGESGTCGGSFFADGETCSSDSTFTVVGRYTGDYKTPS